MNSGGYDHIIAAMQYMALKSPLTCTQFYCDNPLDYAGLCDAHQLLKRSDRWQKAMSRWGRCEALENYRIRTKIPLPVFTSLAHVRRI